MINTKSGERAVQLKYVKESDYNVLVRAFEKYMHNKLNNKPVSHVVQATSSADELLKYAELFEKGLLTEEEFEAKKKELL